MSECAEIFAARLVNLPVSLAIMFHISRNKLCTCCMDDTMSLKGEVKASKKSARMTFGMSVRVIQSTREIGPSTRHWYKNTNQWI